MTKQPRREPEDALRECLRPAGAPVLGAGRGEVAVVRFNSLRRG